MNLDRIVTDALDAVPDRMRRRRLFLPGGADIDLGASPADVIVTADLVEHVAPAAHLAACASLVADDGYLVVVAGDTAPHRLDGGPLIGGETFYAVTTDGLIAALGPGWAVTWRHPTHPAFVARRVTVEPVRSISEAVMIADHAPPEVAQAIIGDIAPVDAPAAPAPRPRRRR